MGRDLKSLRTTGLEGANYPQRHNVPISVESLLRISLFYLRKDLFKFEKPELNWAAPKGLQVDLVSLIRFVQPIDLRYVSA